MGIIPGFVLLVICRILDILKDDCICDRLMKCVWPTKPKGWWSFKGKSIDSYRSRLGQANGFSANLLSLLRNLTETTWLDTTNIAIECPGRPLKISPVSFVRVYLFFFPLVVFLPFLGFPEQSMEENDKFQAAEKTFMSKPQSFLPYCPPVVVL
jgi:hypothetical protein